MGTSATSRSLLSILDTWADVTAALRDPRLVMPGGDVARTHGTMDATRAAALGTAASEIADRLARALPYETPIDLVSTFASPFGLALAAATTGADVATLPELARHSAIVFERAAHATDVALDPHTLEGTTALARALPDAAGPLGVQAFVALAHSVPALVAASWNALAEDRAWQARLRAEAALPSGDLEELLRVAGPSRTVFREATASVSIGDVALRAGDRVALSLGAANRDPTRTRGHLALGRGVHSCYGAPLVRGALAAAVGALLRETGDVALAGAPTWDDGFAIRSLTRLPVVLAARL